MMIVRLSAWAADCGCFLLYETLDCSVELRRFENLDQVEDFLVKREQAGEPTRLPRPPSDFNASEGMPFEDKALPTTQS